MTQLLVELIADLNKVSDLQWEIQGTENKIDKLINRVNDKIDKAVYDCSTVEELQQLCKSIGLDKEGYRWGWEEAYKNSFGGDTDYEKTEWSDIKFHTVMDLRSFIGKKAREKWRSDHGQN